MRSFTQHCRMLSKAERVLRRVERRGGDTKALADRVVTLRSEYLQRLIKHMYPAKQERAYVDAMLSKSPPLLSVRRKGAG